MVTGTTGEWFVSLLTGAAVIVGVVAIIAAVVGGGSYIIAAGLGAIAGLGIPSFVPWMIGAAVLTVALLLIANS